MTFLWLSRNPTLPSLMSLDRVTWNGNLFTNNTLAVSVTLFIWNCHILQSHYIRPLSTVFPLTPLRSSPNSCLVSVAAGTLMSRFITAFVELTKCLSVMSDGYTIIACALHAVIAYVTSCCMYPSSFSHMVCIIAIPVFSLNDSIPPCMGRGLQ